MNIRIVITGGLTQLVFGKKLSGTQWMALTLLAIGCRHLPNSHPSTEPSLPTTLDLQSKQIGIRHVAVSEPRGHTHAGMGLPSCAGMHALIAMPLALLMFVSLPFSPSVLRPHSL